jgi:putative tryptophan/tyrosine transport system substrate-binding protein
MKRRDFFVFAAGALAWPMTTQAQQTHVFRILWLSTASGADPFFDGFRAGLRALGYAEGKNIVLRSHYAPNNPQGLREVVS